ncbi:uncharacterized protein LOC117952597 [Etheostoma cragini]|uniref:uncharacterized protein LOC117952597 n=1 Tax=Etheostoma cragini TaxID=417921 RepID=UPI00155E4829|nr:uncharacterized protein LOC117952597 [Etheostoma cragini]
MRIDARGLEVADKKSRRLPPDRSLTPHFHTVTPVTHSAVTVHQLLNFAVHADACVAISSIAAVSSLLSGQWSSTGGQLCDYRFIGEKKTWKEAQEYCRTYHTDLATVSNQGDLKRLQQLNQSGAWIGLQRDWHWSQSRVEFRDSNWYPGQPNNYNNKEENCVVITNDAWHDYPCAYQFKCICYDENKISGNRFHVSDYSMSWREAQIYCRERYTDLISGVQQLEDFKKDPQNNGRIFWIGLFKDWSWSDGSSFSFRLWDEHKQDPKKTCGMTTSGGFWSPDDCNKTKTFFCYNGESSTRSLTLVFIYICSIYSVKTSSTSSAPRSHHHNGDRRSLILNPVPVVWSLFRGFIEWSALENISATKTDDRPRPGFRTRVTQTDRAHMAEQQAADDDSQLRGVCTCTITAQNSEGAGGECKNEL